MTNHELRDEILVVNLEGPLEAADFTKIANSVDAYLEQHGTLRGVLIHAKSFPRWKSFDALLAHLNFVKEHHRKIEKVAVVADGVVANIMPNIANHFVHAQLRHFSSSDEGPAWDWLRQTVKHP
jgi:SpoIIAA-like